MLHNHQILSIGPVPLKKCNDSHRERQDASTGKVTVFIQNLAFYCLASKQCGLLKKLHVFSSNSSKNFLGFWDRCLPCRFHQILNQEPLEEPEGRYLRHLLSIVHWRRISQPERDLYLINSPEGRWLFIIWLVTPSAGSLSSALGQVYFHSFIINFTAFRCRTPSTCLFSL